MNKYQFLLDFIPYFENITSNNIRLDDEQLFLDDQFEDFIANFELIDIPVFYKYNNNLNSNLDILSHIFSLLHQLYHKDVFNMIVEDKIIFKLLTKLSLNDDNDNIKINEIKQLNQIKMFSLKTGSVLFNRYKEYEVFLSQSMIILTEEGKSKKIILSQKTLTIINELLLKSKFSYWKNYYNNRLIKDGHQWEIIVNDDENFYEFNGSNSYPYFYKYIRKIVSLIDSF